MSAVMTLKPAGQIKLASSSAPVCIKLLSVVAVLTYVNKIMSANGCYSDFSW